MTSEKPELEIELKVVQDNDNIIMKVTPQDDSDIDDLINVEITEEKTSFMNNRKIRINVFELLLAYISLFVMNRPRTSSFIVITFLVVTFLVVNLTLSNAPTLTPESIVEHDYTSIASKYDLTVGKVDHWCLQGGNEKCRCEDPLIPSQKKGYRNWQKAHEKNKDLIISAFTDADDDFYFQDLVDVVFIGENIVETWAGRSIGFNSTFTTDVKKKYDKIFQKSNGGKFNGLPLGIAGDTTSNVLWRIQNGEMPDYLNPSVWWLVLGTNDLAMGQCSEEIVLLGILRVVEEITEMHPMAKIVISSILPMTTDKKGRVPNLSNEDKKEKVDHKKHTDERRQLQEELRKLKQQEESRDLRKRKRNAAPAVRVRMNPFSWARISLWPSVAAINSVLKTFCQKHKHIVFFDAYDIFVDTATDDGIPAVREDMVKSFALGQPTVAGHEALIKGMSSKMKGYYKKWYGEDFEDFT